MSGDILLCDDAPDLRLLMQLALEGAGHRVTAVDGGAALLAQLDDLPDADLLILDVQMPSVDGWTVLESLRRHPRHHDLPVLLCTVKFSHADLLRAWTLGCDGYLAKPFDLVELTGTVAELLLLSPDARRERRLVELQSLASWAPTP